MRHPPSGEDKTVELNPKEGFMVPKNVMHKTRAPQKTVILMVENAGIFQPAIEMNIDWLRKYCLALPHVTEDVKWEDNLCFLIAEKIFCLAHLGGEFSCAIKINEEDFFELTERDGITQASHFARNKWISINESSSLTKKEWEHYLKQSYELVKAKLPKKVLNQLD